MISVVATTLKV